VHDCSIRKVGETPPITSPCPSCAFPGPHCTGPGALEQAGARLSEATAHALIDRFLIIETELAQIRRLLVEEVGI